MTDLTYRLGGLDINSTKFRLSEEEDRQILKALEKLGTSFRNVTRTKFVVEMTEQTTASVYVSDHGRFHCHVAQKFGLPEENLVGGGNCYLNSKGTLILDDYSGDYGAISKFAAEKFAELIKPKLAELGVEVKGISVNPNETKIHSFWQ